MHTVSSAEARATLAMLPDHVTDDQEPVVIARRGKPAVALVALSELGGYRETAYLLRSPANADRLLAALARRQPPRRRGPDAGGVAPSRRRRAG